ncbi:MBL fold metallo-hydrolase [Planctomyces sp. SH-PL62]|uniref:MBL fold metallo-hydrolase n=1 Tax=Planctomyces sp. SH-PL62 TaxID=1636152 RepID=UPI00078E070E|nr:MBL fold metallo-hydrolase [Planctomyces sp. SH-PL62]AMV39375.1 putative L-ascorbate-6-phosphate lactonase UlaG [Planctomyces sp. SH-PL62]
MIEPVRMGDDLVREIEEAVPPSDGLLVWWTGQSGYLIKSAQGLLAVDLYLSEHLTRKYEATPRPHVRMTRSPLSGGDLKSVDLLLASHKHSDHLDPGTVPDLLDASPSAMLVLPEAIRSYATGLGLPDDRLIGVDSGAEVRGAGFHIRAIPSAHEEFDRDSNGRHPYLGFIIEAAGLRLYHSGDTLAYEGLAEALASETLDVLFLPINGRAPDRGVPGNMDAAEAVDLASRVRPRFVVPHHYDMFTFNTAPVEEFERQARRLPSEVEPKVLNCGERWEIRP